MQARQSGRHAANARRTVRQLPPPAPRPQHARLRLLALRTLEDRARPLSPLPTPARDGLPRLRAQAMIGALALAAAAGWTALPHTTLARTEVAAARVGGAVYVAGGYASPDGRTSAVVERYSLRTRRWRRVAPLPRALNHAAAAAWRGRLFILGGYAASGRATRGLYRYDPRRNRWSTLPSAPVARAAMAAGVIGDRLHAAGGAAGGDALRDHWIYDLRRHRWSRAPGLPTAREHVAGAVRDGRLYVIGGRAAGHAGNFTTVEFYDAARRRWSRAPSLGKARGGNAAATVNGTIVTVGGEEGA